jgi:hypothetical protein
MHLSRETYAEVIRGMLAVFEKEEGCRYEVDS